MFFSKHGTIRSYNEHVFSPILYLVYYWVLRQHAGNLPMIVGILLCFFAFVTFNNCMQHHQDFNWPRGFNIKDLNRQSCRTCHALSFLSVVCSRYRCCVSTFRSLICFLRKDPAFTFSSLMFLWVSAVEVLLRGPTWTNSRQVVNVSVCIYMCDADHHG